jgi:Membrane-associated lipoprotein involved in thiamine biosynthesis
MSVTVFPSRNAMAADFEIAFNRGQYPQATEAALVALDEIDRLENVFSAFRDESEISQINRCAAENTVETSNEVWQLLLQCRQLSQETEGAVDITASPLWRLWGFAKRNGKVPPEAELAETLQHVGQSFVQYDETNRGIRFAREGVEISLGCIGKGAALDAAVRTLREHDINDALLHGGRSSISALGGRMQEHWPQTPQKAFPDHVVGELLEATRDRGAGWSIGISHPMRQGHRLAEVRLSNESLGTSGSQHQFFIHQGKRYSHIIDPRTGFPAEGVLMVTVIAPTAAQADALSTAFFVLKPEQTADYCRRHPGVAAMLVLPSERGNDCRILHFGFENNQIRFFRQG